MAPCDPEMRVECVDRLARIEQMLKDRIEQGKETERRVEGMLTRHEHRISALERWRNWMLGACGVAGSVIVIIKNHLRFQV